MSDVKKRNTAMPFRARDLKPIKGKRRKFAGAVPWNLPATYVYTKGFEITRPSMFRSTLFRSLDMMHKSYADRRNPEDKYRVFWSTPTQDPNNE